MNSVLLFVYIRKRSSLADIYNYISSLFEKIQQEYPNVKKGVSLFKRSVIDSVTEWYNKHYGRIVYENEFTLNREEDLNRIKRRAEQNGVRTYS